MIRTLLVRRNKIRDLAAIQKVADGLDNEEELVDVKHADGTTTVEAIDIRWQDLTDKQDLEFR